MSHRPLLAYVPHMLRDYLMTRGGAMVVVAMVFIGPMLLAFGQSETITPEQMRAQALSINLTLVAFLTLIATYGLIGQDFRLGFYRPMFAKPISVPLYYLALFACATVGFGLVHSLMLGIWAAAGVNAWDVGVALEALVRFFVLGALVFLFSRLSRLDWIFAAFVSSLSGALREAYPAESILGWLINVLLPPMQLFELPTGARANGQFSALLGSAGPEWGSIAWLLGYAAACIVLSLVLVRRVPLASAE